VDGAVNVRRLLDGFRLLQIAGNDDTRDRSFDDRNAHRAIDEMRELFRDM
jgi:hypothetical protein